MAHLRLLFLFGIGLPVLMGPGMARPTTLGHLQGRGSQSEVLSSSMSSTITATGLLSMATTITSEEQQQQPLHTATGLSRRSFSSGGGGDGEITAQRVQEWRRNEQRAQRGELPAEEMREHEALRRRMEEWIEERRPRVGPEERPEDVTNSEFLRRQEEAHRDAERRQSQYQRWRERERLRQEGEWSRSGGGRARGQGPAARRPSPPTPNGPRRRPRPPTPDEPRLSENPQLRQMKPAERLEYLILKGREGSPEKYLSAEEILRYQTCLRVQSRKFGDVERGVCLQWALDPEKTLEDIFRDLQLAKEAKDVRSRQEGAQSEDQNHIRVGDVGQLGRKVSHYIKQVATQKLNALGHALNAIPSGAAKPGSPMLPAANPIPQVLVQRDIPGSGEGPVNPMSLEIATGSTTIKLSRRTEA
ncbi:MAG: hypothetical protein M1816_004781 [Peltula sp. TS41687]|nr:MAG: hypothetical protein M1816_004781 [Peltula sp. TS41687]